jgi:protein arginine N-methyltransferase 1
MYSILEYGMMLGDARRAEAYAGALKQAIRPGCSVVDLGSGTGVFSLLACRYGARKVYAIEPNSDATQVAREIARANGFADQIEFYEARAQDVELPEQVDVIVADLRGILPIVPANIPTVMNARDRFLKPGGILLPRRDQLFAAVVEAKALWEALAKPWKKFDFGFDFTAARRMTLNRWHSCHGAAERLLTDPALWFELDYHAIQSPNVQGRLKWNVRHFGWAHGVALAMDAEIAEGFSISCEPGEKTQTYGSAFFPWEEPVYLTLGDAVVFELKARLIDGEYVWAWTTDVLEGGNPQRRKASFRQSTFFSRPVPIRRPMTFQVVQKV